MDPGEWPVKLATCQNLQADHNCSDGFQFNNCIMTAVTTLKNNSKLSIRSEDLGLNCPRNYSLNPKYTYIYLIKLNE